MELDDLFKNTGRYIALLKPGMKVRMIKDGHPGEIWFVDVDKDQIIVKYGEDWLCTYNLMAFNRYTVLVPDEPK